MNPPDGVGVSLLATVIWTDLLEALRADNANFQLPQDTNHVEAGPATTRIMRQIASMVLDQTAGWLLEFDYKNWRGEVAHRRVRGVRLWFGTTEHHPEPCLLLHAIDLDRGVERDFRVLDMTFQDGAE